MNPTPTAPNGAPHPQAGRPADDPRTVSASVPAGPPASSSSQSRPPRSVRRTAILTTLATALVAALAVALPTTADHHDVGNGLEVCSYMEICFHDWTSTDRYRKHFWWSAHHDNYRWWDATANRRVGWVRNDINTVSNRDSSCAVKVIDDNGQHPGSFYVVPNDGWTYLLPSDVRNRNDRHQRVNCSS